MLKTQRLLLRRWTDKDYPYMISINKDPEVMRYFPAIQDEQQTIKMIQKIENHFEKYGFGLYAVELLDRGHCIGFVGLNYTDFKAHFTPAFEIGWRLDKNFWMQGYATEAGRKILHKGFTEFNLNRIVSFTSKINSPSIRVMEKLGLKYESIDDFINPNLPKEHLLAPHVLYKLTKDEYIKNY